MEFTIPDIKYTISALLIFFSVLYFYLSGKKPTTKESPPPEAGGAWPIIGHLHLLRPLPHLKLASMADKYGPIFTIRLGIKSTLVISSPELVKEIFTTHDVVVSSRPKFLVGQHLGYDYTTFGFSPYGPYWREMRKLVAVEMLSVRRLELLRHVRVSETELQLTELFKYWKEKKDGSGQVPVEMKQWFGDLNLNVVLRMVAGKRYFGLMAEGEAVERLRCRRLMREFFDLAGFFAVADCIPFLKWVDLDGCVKRMQETGRELDVLMQEWLDEHHRYRQPEAAATAGEEKTSEKDFMDVMIKIIKDGGFEGRDPDTIIKATCQTLIVGGADTTIVVLVWALCLLLNNRHALRKAQEELDTHIGRERRCVNESDISNLVYLQAIVKETLRLYPAGPLGGMREFTENCKIAGYNIPNGTRLVINLWKLQRDPKVWSDPEEFKPERFFTNHMDFDVKGQNFELIPFGAGRRICPGAAFGLQMLHLVLANLLHMFELTTPGDKTVDMSETAGLTNSKTTPLDVLVTPRLPLSVY